MSLWAVSAYFNPARFRTRYANYQTFRQALALPLLTVEWSPASRFELDDADADRLIRIGGGDLMWQKERLLNVAITALPASCDQVAWFDCDVLYPDDAWLAAVPAALERVAVVQLFSRVVHLPGAEPERITSPAMLVRDALVARFEARVAARARAVEPIGTDADTNAPDPEREARELARLSARPSSGHAWAARRDLLAEHGLYDACICGTGDMAAALAALGRPWAFVEDYPLSAAQQDHYLAWAEPFAAAVAGQVGVLPATLVHLFHGRMIDRQYRARLDRLAASGFDPGRDLRASAEGAWEWARRDPSLIAFMDGYFRDRREDG